MQCYNKDGPVCVYCVPGEYTSDDPETFVYGMPRYNCIHPIEHDVPIDPNVENKCPRKYKIKEVIINDT